MRKLALALLTAALVALAPVHAQQSTSLVWDTILNTAREVPESLIDLDSVGNRALADSDAIGSAAPAVQGGMSKATMLLLMNDLLNAGYSPTVDEADGLYSVTVNTDHIKAATAAQVNTFANNRGVTAKILAVRFQ